MRAMSSSGGQIVRRRGTIDRGNGEPEDVCSPDGTIRLAHYRAAVEEISEWLNITSSQQSLRSGGIANCPPLLEALDVSPR